MPRFAWITRLVNELFSNQNLNRQSPFLLIGGCNETGLQGEKGEKAERPFDGVRGDRGLPGERGLPGMDGIPGVSGFPGAKGKEKITFKLTERHTSIRKCNSINF